MISRYCRDDASRDASVTRTAISSAERSTNFGEVQRRALHEEMLYMNKSMLMGVALGIGVATAGGVAAYQFFGAPRVEQGSALADPQPGEQSSDAVTSSAEQAEAAAAAPRSSSSDAARPSVQAAPAPAPSAAALPDCNPDASKPKDGKRIAVTTIGALVGGAVARDVGDRDLTTAVGAAVGAFAGNKIQQKIQERKAAQTGAPCAQ
jgi:uncharacterized protein YcfJ